VKKTAVVIDMANVKRTQDKTTHLVCAETYYHRPRPCPRCCVTPADVPPIREAGVPWTLLKDQGPLVIQCLGTTEGPSGSPHPRQPIRRRPLLGKSRSLSPASRRGRADGSAEHKRSSVRSAKADRIAIGKRQRCPWWRMLPRKTSATSTAHRAANIR